MLKSNIVEEISESFKLDKNLSKQIIDVLINSISESIQSNDRTEIRGLGSFFPKSYKSYKGRNPKTGDSINVPEKVLPIYRPSKELIEKLNKK